MNHDADWHLFERAVEAFLRALDPGATVIGNAKLPDRHTGVSRQRDVWIETTVLKQFPINILVSCKRYKRKLSSQDIDAFNGEFLSSTAHKGVIYSYSGFSRPALEKANILGVSCCRLYENEPADLPAVLLIPNCYASYPQVQVSIRSILRGRDSWKVWDDLLQLPAGELNGEPQSVADVLAAVFAESENSCVTEANRRNTTFPLSWINDLTIRISDGGDTEIGFKLVEGWIDYVAKIEAHLVNGSYSFSDHTFIGTQMTPSIDTWGATPGEGWARLPNRPQSAANCVHFTRGIGKLIKQAISAQFGNRPIIIDPDSAQ